MDTVWLIAQGIGVIGLVANVASLQFKRRKTLLMLQLITATLFAAHFALLGAFTGAALNVVSMTRSAIFYQRLDYKWASYAAWPILFIGVVWASATFTWEGWISLLPAVAMSLGTLALWSKETKNSRILILAGRPLWLSYNVFAFSIPGMITETLLMASAALGIWRLDMYRKPRKTNT